MSRGFYNLASGMLTQQRKINVSSNNIGNINTPGYKKEQSVTSNFGSLLINKYKQNGIHDEAEPLNNVSIVRAIIENNTFHSQGDLEETGLSTDFAIVGTGFFGVNVDNQLVYTRNGSFSIDREGYLTLEGAGRVQGEAGDIYIGTHNFNFIENGSIIVDDEIIDRINVYDFVDYGNLNKYGEGMFLAGEEPYLLEDASILHKTIEKSNVNLTQELSDIMASQRALQTASQVLKMYDMINEQAVNEIGKIG